MNYLRGALSAASQYYRDINPSTLTGAIDVIVVRRTEPARDGPDGTMVEELACSPFHVRFGKWQVLRPVDKKVKVMVNGREIPFYMKIGDAGEAFFVFETDGDVPEDLITSPILEATHPGRTNDSVEAGRFGAKEEGTENDERGPTELETERLGEPEPLDLDSPDTGSTSNAEAGPSTPTPSTADPAQATTEHDEEPAQESEGSSSQSGLVNRTAGFGKAMVKAAVEINREEQQRIRDRIDAARNAAAHAYENFDYLKKEDISGNDNHGKGDEALPRIKDGEGEPPTVVYSEDVALDASGYHSMIGPEEGTSKERPRRASGHSSLSSVDGETDEYDSHEGRSTPRSGGLSAHATPTQSPDTSRSPSPQGRPDSSPKANGNELATSLPLRAASEPPETEYASEISPQQAYSWEWGAFPTPSPMRTTFSTTKGKFSDTQRSISVPPELPDSRPASPTRSRTEGYSMQSLLPSDDASFFGEDAELTADETNGRRFLVSICGRTQEFELSISEELAVTEGGGSGDELLDAQRFRAGRVSFRRFMKYPAVVQDKNLVIKWNDRYITHQDGSVLMDCLVKWREYALAKPVNARALEEEEPLSSSDEQEPETEKERTTPKKSSSSWVRWWRSSRSEPQSKSQTPPVEATPRASNGVQKIDPQRPPLLPSNSAPPDSEVGGDTPIPFPTLSTSKSVGEASDNGTYSYNRDRRFAKTLRLTSDQLKQLGLKSGMNSITFSLASTGATACTASIFLWESTDSVVVSDIDGTITKSDALGHVFTMIGRDWTHLGVAKLYTDICRNGYRIMYLTSRAIGQADSTRYYLKSINQNNYQLPQGPVVMSPDRLMASFHREVIMRKPEVFKMACLRDIQRLFGEGQNPFYAGFGNRITDALSYRSVNIPSQRIFTIDSTGEVKMELLEVAGYKSSYIHLTDLVDQMFPPVHRKTPTEFSDNNFWRTPVPDYPLPDLAPEPVSPALSARSDTAITTSTFSRLRNFSLRQSTGALFPLPPTPPRPGTADGGRAFKEMTPLDRLSNRHTRSTETLMEHTWSDDERGRMWSRSEDERERSRERRARKRLSLDSMPGSLSGSPADFDFDDEEEEEGQGGDDDEYEGDQDEGEPEDPEEAAEDGFDEDLLATGEMESVPFL